MQALVSPLTVWLCTPGRSVFGKVVNGKAQVVLVDVHMIAATEEANTIEEAMAACLNALQARAGKP